MMGRMDTELLSERVWVGQYETGKRIGIEVRSNGVLTDAEDDVLVTMKQVEDDTVVFEDRPAEQMATGTYDAVLTSADTTILGLYNLTFAYPLVGAQTFVGYLEVTSPAPTYLALSDEAKIAVERTWQKL